MKTFILLTALALSTILSAEEPNKSLAAQSLISSKVEMTNSHELSVQFNNPLEKNIVVKVYSEGNTLIMKKTINGEAQYNALYTLDDLSEGQYQISLYLKDEMIEKKSFEVK